MLLLAAIGGLLGLALVGCVRVWRSEARPDRIVALLYHRLVSEAEFATFPTLARNFTIPEPRFREHLARLRRAGYAPVTLDAVLDRIELGKELPPRPVLVTFDDGCESVHSRALPALRELGFPAALFVTTDAGAWIFRSGPDAQRRLSEAEIRALDAGGVAIGSHAKSHDPLQTMSEAEIEHELGDSKRWLEGVLGKPVRYFAVPLNWYGDKVRAAAQRLGYRAVCTSDTGTIHPQSDPFHLRRLNVEGWMTADDLEALLTPTAIVQRRVIAFAKRFPARLIGPRLWLPFRRWLFASPVGPLLTLRNLRRALLAATALAALLLFALLAR
jgi:peptidoglycan/xylan/chitin deacetylase (PgdA/CDA1 family)